MVQLKVHNDYSRKCLAYRHYRETNEQYEEVFLGPRKTALDGPFYQKLTLYMNLAGKQYPPWTSTAMPYRMGRGLSAKNSVFFDKTHIERKVIFSDLAWHAVRTSDVNSKVRIDRSCELDFNP